MERGGGIGEALDLDRLLEHVAAGLWCGGQ